MGHDDNTTFPVPVTWIISRMRVTDAPPDERYRESNDVFLTEVRVRFTVRYSASFRIRMMCYRSHTPYVFLQAALSHVQTSGKPASNDNLVQAFQQEMYSSSHWVSHAPFAVYASNRDDDDEKAPPTINATWVIESPNGFVFSADLAKRPCRPLGTFTISDSEERSTGFQGSVKWREIDWYCPIDKTIRYTREVGKETYDEDYQILFSYDVPHIFKPAKLATIAMINGLSVKVYYR